MTPEEGHRSHIWRGKRGEGSAQRDLNLKKIKKFHDSPRSVPVVRVV